MHKIKLSIFILLLIICGNVISQQVIRQTLSSIGNSSSLEGITISQTIGQPSSTSSEKMDKLLINQGFQQPLLFHSQAPQFTTLEISAYPNPINSFLNLEILSGNVLDLKIRVHNSIGKVISEIKPSEMSMKLNFENRAPGIYFVTFHSESGESKTIKITKIK